MIYFQSLASIYKSSMKTSLILIPGRILYCPLVTNTTLKIDYNTYYKYNKLQTFYYYLHVINVKNIIEI